VEITSDQAINDMIQARADSTQQKVAIAVAVKQLDAQKQQGDAAIKLIEQAVLAQRQLASGRLDVKI